MKRRFHAMLLVLLIPFASWADEESVYETLSEVAVGRVFTSQAQRDALDARRLVSGSDGIAASTASSDDAESSAGPESAGHIIVRKGPVKVWKDGDFVASGDRPARTMSFPGDVEITRHRPARQAEEATETGEADSDRESEDGDR